MKQKEPVQKTVTIIYGNNANDRTRILNEKIAGKNSFELFEADVLGCDIRVLRSTSAPIDIYFSECLAIDDFAILIESEAAVTNERARILKPQLVFNVASFSPTDINYFGKMEHVSLIPCNQKSNANLI